MLLYFVMYNPSVDKPRQSHQLAIEALPQPQSPLPYLDDYILPMAPEVVEPEDDLSKFDKCAIEICKLTCGLAFPAGYLQNERLFIAGVSISLLALCSVPVRHAGVAIYKKFKTT